ncbi:hypothetical protein [Paenibacillus sp. FSL H3-0302]|uniref:hypothetical protein n=1 Tax=Paenibacillus sp. FSL H3-0302 TaxID=2921428 RepID=UPI0030EE93AE
MTDFHKILYTNKNPKYSIFGKKRNLIYRKIASLVLISSLLLGSTGVVSASSSNNNDVEAQISKIYQERADLLGEHKAGYEIEYEKLGKELESLGVDYLTPEEAQVVIAQKILRNRQLTNTTIC